MGYTNTDVCKGLSLARRQLFRAGYRDGSIGLRHTSLLSHMSPSTIGQPGDEPAEIMAEKFVYLKLMGVESKSWPEFLSDAAYEEFHQPLNEEMKRCGLSEVVQGWLVTRHEDQQDVLVQKQMELYRTIHDAATYKREQATLKNSFKEKALADIRCLVKLPADEQEVIALVDMDKAEELRRYLSSAAKEDVGRLVNTYNPLHEGSHRLPVVCMAMIGPSERSLGVLLDYGPDLEARCANGHVALHIAIALGDKEAAERAGMLLAHGAKADALGGLGQTALCMAASEGLVLTVRQLLQYPSGQATVNQADNFGIHPLGACLRGISRMQDRDRLARCLILRMLRQHGADPLLKNDKREGRSAYSHALELGLPDVFEALGVPAPPAATPLPPRLTEGERAFARACEAEDVEALKACMDHYDLRLDGTKSDAGLNRVLHEVASEGRWPVMRAALEKDAARRAQAKVGLSILHEAAAGGDPELVHILLIASSKAAEVNGRDATNGMTPLMHAAAKGHIPAMVILLQFDADTSLKDKKGRTALAHALRNNHKDVKNLLADVVVMTERIGNHKGKADRSESVKHVVKAEDKGEKQEVDLEAEQKAAEAAASLLEEHEAQAASSKASGSKSAKPKPKKKKPSKDDKKKTAAAGPAGPKAPLDQDDDQDHDQDHDEGHKQQAPQSSRPGNEQGARDAGAARDPELHKDALELPGADGAKDHSTDKGRVEPPSTDKQPKKGGASPPPPASKATNNKPSATNSEVNQSNPLTTVAAGKAERVLSEESTQSHGSVEGPDPLICPISFELMTDPVIASDGNTYQRDAIKQWFEECQSADAPITSPVNGGEMTSRELKQNAVVRRMVDRYLANLVG